MCYPGRKDRLTLTPLGVKGGYLREREILCLPPLENKSIPFLVCLTSSFVGVDEKCRVVTDTKLTPEPVQSKRRLHLCDSVRDSIPRRGPTGPSSPRCPTALRPTSILCPLFPFHPAPLCLSPGSHRPLNQGPGGNL